MNKLVCKKKNKICAFWYEKEQKCVALENDCYPIIDKCEGCEKIYQYEEKSYCKVYTNPERKWATSPCFFKIQREKMLEEEEKRKKLNPLKASKRKRRMEAQE